MSRDRPALPGAQEADAFGQAVGGMLHSLAGLNVPPTALGALQADYLKEAATLWNSRRAGFGFQTSESVDGYSQSFTPYSLGGSASGSSTPVLVSPAAQMMLRPFRRPAIGGL